jgi:hypothetical protein
VSKNTSLVPNVFVSASVHPVVVLASWRILNETGSPVSTGSPNPGCPNGSATIGGRKKTALLPLLCAPSRMIGEYCGALRVAEAGAMASRQPAIAASAAMPRSLGKNRWLKCMWSVLAA